jgi:tetratricopeptide (TPR) repeat protein
MLQAFCPLLSFNLIMKFNSLLCCAAIIAGGMSTVLIEHSVAKQSSVFTAETVKQNTQVAQKSIQDQAAELSITSTVKIMGEDYQGAMEDINQAIALVASEPRYYGLRAICKEFMKDYRGALADYNKSISLDSLDSFEYIRRGKLKYQHLKDHQGALADFNTAVSLDPADKFTYKARAEFRTNQLQDFKGALEDYNKALALQPNDTELYISRAALKSEKLNDLRGALDDYNLAVSLAVEGPRGFVTPHIERANFKASKLNDRQGGLADMNYLVSVAPNDVSSYFARARYKVKHLQDYQGALVDLDKVVAIAPSWYLSYLERGKVRYKLNNKAGAIADIQKVAQIARQNNLSDGLQTAQKLLQSWGVNELITGEKNASIPLTRF